MSGHNKFSKIKNIKAKNDAATGRFSQKLVVKFKLQLKKVAQTLTLMLN